MGFRFSSLKNILGLNKRTSVIILNNERDAWGKHRSTSAKNFLSSRSLRLEELEDRRLLSATHWVNTNLDVVDADDDFLSLREAITAAESGDTIKFENSVDWATESIKLDTTLGQLVIDKDLTIDASDVTGGNVTIDAQRCTYNEETQEWTGTAAENGRVFLINDGIYDNAISVTMKNLTITGGNVSAYTLSTGEDNANSYYKCGGGIWNTENLTLENVIVTGNKAVSDGGGIYTRAGNWYNNSANQEAFLYMTGCEVTNNSSGYFGGGIQMTTADTDISKNPGYTGPVYTGALTAEIRDCLIDGNKGVYTGGVASCNGLVNVTIDKTKITNNISDDCVGGLFVFRNDNQYTSLPNYTTVTNSMIVDNQSLSNKGNGLLENAGGVYVVGNARFDMENTIVANNQIVTVTETVSRDFALDIRNPAAGAPVSPITVDVADSIIGTGITNGTGINANSGEIADPTTVPEVVSSVVGESSKGGVTKKVDPPANLDVTQEGQTVAAAYGLVVTTADDNITADDDVSLREAIQYALTTEGLVNPTITFADDLVGTTITLTGALEQITKSMTIAGTNLAGDDLNITINGNGFQIFNINDETDEAITVTLDSLTLTGGASLDNDGGAIYNAEALVISDCTFTYNTAARGGAIYNTGDLTVVNSTFWKNSVTSTLGYAKGGAIFNAANAELTLINSTFNQNTADKNVSVSYGGAVCNEGSALVLNSILTGNSAKKGSDICSVELTSSLDLYYSVYYQIKGTLNTNIKNFSGVFQKNIFDDNSLEDGTIAILNNTVYSVSGTLIGSNDEGLWYYDVLDSKQWINVKDNTITLDFDSLNSDGSYGLGEKGNIFDEAQNRSNGENVSRTNSINVFNSGAYGLETFQLGTPSNIAAVPVPDKTDYQIKVTWNAVAGAARYEVKWGEDSSIVTDTEYTITGLSPNTPYVISVTTLGTEDESEIVLGATSSQTGFTSLKRPDAEIVAGTITENSCTVSWDAVPAANHYVVVWSLNSDFSGSSNSGNLNTTSYNITGLDSDKQYFVKVRAIKNTSETDYDSESYPPVTVTTSMGTPDLTAIADTAESVQLEWTEYEGATYYYQYKLTTENWGTTETEINDNSATVTRLSAGTTYNFRVRAVRGQSETSWGYIDATTLLATPSITSVTPESSSELTVKWTPTSGCNYTIAWSTTDGTVPPEGASIKTDNSGSYTIKILNPNTKYYVWIKATITGNESAWSASESGTTLLATPSIDAVTPKSSSELTVTWTPTTGSDYTIAWSTTDGDVPPIDASTDADSSGSYTIGDFDPNTEYYVWIKETITGNESAWSASQSAKTKLATPSLSADGGVDSIKFSWKPVAVKEGETVAYNYSYTVGEVTKSGTTTDTSVTVNDLSAEQSCTFTVYASITGNTSESATSIAKTLKAGPVIRVVSQTPESFTVSWTSDENAIEYEYCLKTGTDEGDIITSDTNENVIIGEYYGDPLTPNTEYTIQVRAIYAGDTRSAWSTPATTVWTQLDTPAINSGTPNSDTQITISWTDSNPGEHGYKLVWSTESNDDPETITDNVKNGSGTITSETITGLDSDTTYYFWIKATGKIDSAWSASYSVTTKLSAPVIDSVETLSSSSISVTWNTGISADHYVVYYSNDNFVSTSEKSVSGTTTTIEYLDPNTLYSFKVKAFKTSETSVYDSTDSIIETAKTFLTTPGNLKGVSEDTSSIKFSWDSVPVKEGETVAYNYSYTIDGEATEGTTTDTFFTVNDLSAEQSCTFTVYAISSSGNTSESATSIAKTLKAGPVIRVVSQTPESFTVSWTSDENAIEYEYCLKTGTDEGDIITSDTNENVIIGEYYGDPLTPNTEYTIQVRAIYAGDTRSAWSTPATTVWTQLDTPAINSGTPNSDTQITISWTDSNQGEHGYKLVWSTESNDDPETITDNVKNGSGTITSEIITGLDSDTTYYFWIKATGKFDSAWSASYFVTTKLSAPVIDSVETLSSSSISVTWNTGISADHYVVYYSNDNFVTTSEKSVSGTTTTTIDDLESNTLYSFKVKAFKNSETSDYDSADSNIETAKTFLTTPSLTEGGKTSESITVNWTPISGATSYDWECYNGNEIVKSGNVTEVVLTVDGLDSGVSYIIRVTAKSSDNHSEKAETGEIKTLLIDPVLMANEVTRTHNQITINWDPVSNATGYNWRYKKDAEDSIWTEGTKGQDELSLTASGLTNNTDYIFQVQATDGTTQSDWSEIIVRTREADPLVVTTNEDIIDPEDGVTSLREAITYVNNYDGSDSLTITFDLSEGNKTITLKSSSDDDAYGTLLISKSLTIDAQDITIDGNDICRIFEITDGEDPLDVKMKGLTITNGSDEGGAGIVMWQENGLLLVENCLFKDNESTSIGGAILSSGKLIVVDSTFVGNKAVEEGGAIDNMGEAHIVNSTFYANTANAGSAIYNDPYNEDAENNLISGKLLVIDSTFTANGSDAISNFGKAWILNSILTGNGSIDIATDPDAETNLVHVLYNTSEGSMSRSIDSQFGITVADTFANLTNGIANLETDGTVVIRPGSAAAFNGTLAGIDVTGSVWYYNHNVNDPKWINIEDATEKTFDSANSDGNYGLGAEARVVINGQNGASRIQSLGTTDQVFNVGAYALENVKLMTPEIISVTADSQRSITVNWSPVDHAGSYIVYWGTNSDFTQYEDFEEGITATAWSIDNINDTPLAPDTLYYVWVKAIPAAGQTYITESDNANANQRTKLAQPDITDASADSSQSITVTWDEVTGADYYSLEYKGGSVTDWTECANGDIQIATVAGLTRDTEYTFRVMAKRNEEGNTNESDYSEIVTCYTLIDSPVITSITNTNAKTLNQYVLNWSKPESSSVSGYSVEYKQTSEDGWVHEAITVNGADNTTYTFTLSNDTQYDFRVTAIAISGHKNSETSDPVSMLAIEKVTPVTGSWTISFNGLARSEEGTAYNVYRSVTNDIATAVEVEFNVVDNSDISKVNLTRTATDASEAATGYYYWLQLCKGTAPDITNVSYIALTTDSAVRMQDKSQGAPQNLKYTAVTSQSITLTWEPGDSKAPSSTYTLQRSDNIDFSNPVTLSSDITADSASWIDNGRSANTTYYYRVKTNATEGYAESSWSVAAPVTTAMANPVVSATSIDAKSFSVTWTDTAPTHASTYKVFVSTDSDAEPDKGQSKTVEWVQGGTMSLTVSDINGTPLDAHTEYFVKVLAEGADTDHDSDWAGTSVTTKLEAPVLTKGEITSDSVTINWGPVTGANNYSWQWRKHNETEESEWSSVNDTDLCTLTQAAGIVGNTSYDFRVRANDSANNGYSSVWSNITVTTEQSNKLKVNTLDEDNDPENNILSLREAIYNACTGLYGTTVTFDSAVFNAQSTDTVIKLTQGEIEITEAITIDANFEIEGVDISVSAGQFSRIFKINTSTGTTTIKGLTLINGKITSGYGAGIYALSDLMLEDCAVTDNIGYKYGGGIYSSAVLTITDTEISGNSVKAGNSAGGGIYSSGSLEIRNSSITENTSSGKLGRGAGIFSSGTAIIEGAIISGNTLSATTTNGGGIYNSGLMTIRNSVISENSARQDGGGIYNFHSGVLTVVNSEVKLNSVIGTNATGAGLLNNGGSVTLVNVTVAGNSATLYGGGLGNESSGSVFLYNTIIANNWAKTSGTENVYGLIDSQSSNNITEDPTATLFTQKAAFNSNGEVTNKEGVILSLVTGNHGAIDGGSNEIALQYGLNSESLDIGEKPRFSGVIDIGAWEFQHPTGSPAAVAELILDDLFELELDFIAESAGSNYGPMNSDLLSAVLADELEKELSTVL